MRDILPKHFTVTALVTVEEGRIDTVELPHAAADIPKRGMQQQVGMVTHQAINMRFDREQVAQITQYSKKALALFVLRKHVLASRNTIHHVVPRILEFDAQ